MLTKKRFYMTIFVIIGVIAIVGVAVGPIMSQVETPNYEVIESSGNIEFRRYPEMTIANVIVDGNRDEAIGDGFRLLADYIFGNNASRQEIAMTAPVMQQLDSDTFDLSQTQPLTASSWRVNFVMPTQYQITTLPQPMNDKVTLSIQSQAVYAVIRFSGKASAELLQHNTRQLLDNLAGRSIAVRSSPIYAFYNPPWTLPMMRRNEVMMEVNYPIKD